ncbi:MAG: hypothetical protein QOI63_1978 [Thermoplasmata archaeon]|nr:hypothetical protein [Thermoplasmata archaeon]
MQARALAKPAYSVNPPALQVQGGYGHYCVLIATGNVDCDGDDWAGQNRDYLGGNGVQISSGKNHNCVLTTTKNVLCWGENNLGQARSDLGGNNVMVASGEGNNCVLKTNGNVVCWGGNGNGQSASRLGGDNIGVGMGQFHTCVIKVTRNVDCYGYNGFGAANDYFGGDAVAVTGGFAHTCILKLDHNVHCYGGGQYTHLDYFGGDAVQISAFDAWYSYGRTCILTTAGTVKCDGYAPDGTLTFVDVDTLGDATFVEVTYNGELCMVRQAGWADCAYWDWSPPPNPTTPLNVQAETGPGRGQITFHWDPPAEDGSLPLTYYFSWGPDPNQWWLWTYGQTQDTSFLVTGLPDDQVEYFQVYACHYNGCGPQSDPVSGRALSFNPPSAPLDPSTAPGPGMGEISLLWRAPTEHAAFLKEYKVYRSNSAAGPFALAGTSSATTLAFHDSGRTAGVTYYYRVSAVNEVGEGPPSPTVAARADDVPGAPRDLTVQPLAAQVMLQWRSPLGDGGRSLDHYQVYSSADGGSYTALATVPAASTTYTATACTPQCFYQVTAVNQDGESAPSNAAAALPAFATMVPESIRGNTPFSGVALKPAFPCDEFSTGSVNLVNGQVMASICLMTAVSPLGLDTTIRLTHRTHSNVAGVVGHNWALSLMRRIDLESNGDATLTDETGRQDRFAWDAAASAFRSPPGFYQVLQANPDGSHTLLRPGGLTEQFDAAGRRTRVADSAGNSVTFTYDLQGRPMQVQDLPDRSLTFQYASGKLAAVNDFAGRTTWLRYDANGDLSAIETPSALSGSGHRFSYDAGHNLLTAQDPDGQVYLANTYDSQGRVAQQGNGLGTYTFTYDTANAQTTAKDPNGNVVVWGYQSQAVPVHVLKRELANRGISASDPAESVTRYTLNGDQEVTRVDLPGGRVAESLFDSSNADRRAQGNLLRSTDRAPGVNGGPAPNPQVTTYTYEPVYQRLRSQTSPLGNDPSYVPPNGGTWSADRYTITYWYSEDEAQQGDLNGDGATGSPGRMVRVDLSTVNTDGGPQERAQTLVYNDRGQVIQDTQPDGSSTTYDYYESDEAGFGRPLYALERIDYQDAPTATPHRLAAARLAAQPIGMPTTTTPSETFAYDAAGHVRSVTDGNGNTRNYTYDGVGRLATDEPLPGLVTTFTYDGNGNLVRKESPNALQQLDGSYVADPAHPVLVETYTYNVLDKPLRATKDAARPAGVPSSQPETLAEEFVYDPNGNVVVHKRNGALNGTTPDDLETYLYDEQNRLVATTEGGRSPLFAAANPGTDLAGIQAPFALYLRSTTSQVASCAVPGQIIGNTFCASGAPGPCAGGALGLAVRGNATCLLPSGQPPAPPGAKQIGKLPSVRMGTSAVWDAARGKAYVFGGLTTTPTDEIIAVDGRTGTATVVGHLPSARWSTAAVFDGTRAYVFGGCLNPACNKVSGDVVRFDPATGLALAVAQLPVAIGSETAVWDGKLAYLFGGCATPCQTAPSRILTYDPARNVAQDTQKQVAMARENMASLWDSSHQKAVLFGAGPDANRIVTYNPATGQSVVSNTTLPAKGANVAAAWDGQLAYVVGARQGSATAPLYQYDPQADRLTTLNATLPAPADHMSATWAQGSALFFGGDLARGGRSDAIVRFTPPDPNWAWAFTLNQTASPSARIVAAPNVAAAPATVAWDWAPAVPHAFYGQRVQAVVWAMQSSASPGSNTWTARLFSNGTLVAAKTMTFPVAPIGVPGQYRFDLGTPALSGGRLRLELDLGSAPGGRLVLFDSAMTPSRLEIGNMATSATTYDAQGNVLVQADPSGAQTVFSRDGFGRPAAVTDAAGTQRVATYDSAGRLVHVEAYGTLGGSLPNAPLGRVQRFFDEAGQLYRQDVAAFDPATGAPLPDGPLTSGDGQVTTLWSHDLLGRVVARTDDNGGETTFSYDVRGHLVRQQDATGNAVASTYDAAGNLVRQTASDLAANGSVLPERATLFAYDPLGHLIRQTDPLGRTVRFGHDANGNLAWKTDARGPAIADSMSPSGTTNDHGNLVRFLRDGQGRLLGTDSELHQGGDASGALLGVVRTRQEWDGDGRLVRQIDDQGRATAYAYDAQGRVVHVADPDGATRSFAYDAQGNVASVTDANGNTIQQAHDAAGRLTMRTVTGPAAFSTQQSFQYDGLGRLTHATDNNDPAQPATTAALDFAYDSLGNLASQRQGGLTVSTAYDGLGNPVQATYPNGRTVQRSFDALGHVTEVSDTTGTLATFSYDGPGRVASRTAGNGVETLLTHDLDGEITSITHALPNTPLPLKTEYAYDAGGNRVQELLHQAPEWSQQASFDSLGRLTEMSRSNSAGLPAAPNPLAGILPQSQAWTLDGANEWDSLSTTQGGTTQVQTLTHGPAHDLQSITAGSTTTPYHSDANGNRQSDGTRTYSWDAFNRLRQVKDGATGAILATYHYDALGRRVEKVASGATTAYVYDGQDVVEERDGAGRLLAQYVPGPQVDQPILMDRNRDGDGSATGAADQRLYYLQDALGSVVGLMDQTGGLAEGYLYDAYGHTVVLQPGAASTVQWDSSDHVASASALGNPYGFTGQRFDQETGLYFYRARYYDPATGSFLSRDPVGAWLDTPNLGNAYAYVGNNPALRTDPSGQCPWCIGAIIGAAAGAIIGFGGYALEVAFTDEKWDTQKAADWTARGLIAGAFLGSGVGAAYGLAELAGAGAISYGVANVGTYAALATGAFGASDCLDANGCFTSPPQEYLSAALTGALFGFLESPTGSWTSTRSGPAPVPTRLGSLSTVLENTAKGTGGQKVGVIGENMNGRVIPFARELEERGFRPVTFRPSAPDLTMEEALAENRAWIRQLKEEGCPVYDCGPDPLRTAAERAQKPFYPMELNEMDGYWNYHPEWRR